VLLYAISNSFYVILGSLETCLLFRSIFRFSWSF